VIFGASISTLKCTAEDIEQRNKKSKNDMNHHPEAIQQAKAPPTASSGCMFLMRFGKKMRFRL
jgi:hypothetical protein